MISESIPPNPARSPGRPREFDMGAVLDGAVRIFRERGYHATSITDLSDATGLTAGSIYKAFQDKRGLFLAAFDRYVDERGQDLRRRLDIQPDAREKIRAVLLFYADSSQGEQGRLGCLVVGSATVLSTFDADVAARIEASLRRIQDLLRTLLREGQRDGSIAADISVSAMSSVLLAVLQGFRVIGKSGRTAKEMRRAADEAMRLLGQPPGAPS
ncbi:TetR family transcriptional regulator [Bordetella genomosp. 9]|uniref:TetR family transcriptional regulator n=2 Tax=Bordetella genomosp. 9 TaxID=1416803 RepID=A0A261R3L4_9BORD|nr:TetR family transcriptional regulator [Bordetella genomosp. 9]